MRLLLPFRSEKSHPLLPGLEVYKTIEYAKKNNIDIHYAEKALGKSTLNALKSEKRMNFYGPLFRSLFYNNHVSHWNREYDAIINELGTTKFEDIVESFDDVKMNLLNNCLERKIPF